MNKKEVVIALEELIDRSEGVRPSYKDEFLRNGIIEIVKELESDTESSNNKMFGSLSMKLNVDDNSAMNSLNKIESKLARIHVLMKQINKESEKIGNIKIGVEINDSR